MDSFGVYSMAPSPIELQQKIMTKSTYYSAFAYHMMKAGAVLINAAGGRSHQCRRCRAGGRASDIKVQLNRVTHMPCDSSLHLRAVLKDKERISDLPPKKWTGLSYF
jgi:hypothetical protein